MTDVLVTEVSDGVATLTLNRPDVRNALSSELLSALATAMTSLDEDDGVDVVIVTGADPAFCAGLDLQELATPGNALEQAAGRNPWPRLTKPTIAAVNGAAITGGLELALHCDFIIASTRARFADTHARVGILPGWGLSVVLPQRIGMARAIEASMSGNFIDAGEAERIGLANHVVPHDELLPYARRLGRDIADADRAAVRALLASYRRIADATGLAEGFRLEQEAAKQWHDTMFDPAEIERRRAGVVSRGRGQAHGSANGG